MLGSIGFGENFRTPTLFSARLLNERSGQSMVMRSARVPERVCKFAPTQSANVWTLWAKLIPCSHTRMSGRYAEGCLADESEFGDGGTKQIRRAISSRANTQSDYDERVAVSAGLGLPDRAGLSRAAIRDEAGACECFARSKLISIQSLRIVSLTPPRRHWPDGRPVARA